MTLLNSYAVAPYCKFVADNILNINYAKSIDEALLLKECESKEFIGVVACILNAQYESRTVNKQFINVFLKVFEENLFKFYKFEDCQGVLFNKSYKAGYNRYQYSEKLCFALKLISKAFEGLANNRFSFEKFMYVQSALIALSQSQNVDLDIVLASIKLDFMSFINQPVIESKPNNVVNLTLNTAALTVFIKLVEGYYEKALVNNVDVYALDYLMSLHENPENPPVVESYFVENTVGGILIKSAKNCLASKTMLDQSDYINLINQNVSFLLSKGEMNRLSDLFSFIHNSTELIP